MDIIIKGIDLDTDYGLCILTIDGELITANGKHFQAIQIPTPHGRLIDENELKTKIHDVTLEGGALHGCIDKTVLHEVSAILEEEE